MDEELTSEDAKTLQDHLAVCERCNLEYRSLLYSYNLVAQLSPIESRSDCWENIRTRIQSARETRGFFSRFLFPNLWVPVGAVGVLVLFTASLLWFIPGSDRSRDMHQLMNNYIQERNQEFAKKGIRVDRAGVGMRLVTYNPFRESDPSSKGNPFKAE